MSALEKKRCSLLFGCTEKFLTETLPVHCCCVGQKQSRQWCFYFTDEMHSDCQNTSIRLKLDRIRGSADKDVQFEFMERLSVIIITCLSSRLKWHQETTVVTPFYQIDRTLILLSVLKCS